MFSVLYNVVAHGFEISQPIQEAKKFKRDFDNRYNQNTREVYSVSHKDSSDSNAKDGNL